MLDRTQKGLLLEIEAASTAMAPHLVSYEKDLLRVCGPAYGGAGAEIEGDPENHWQEWLSIFLPQLVYANPQCSVSTDMIQWPPERTKALEYALNAWGPLTDVRHEIERAAVDFAIRWACGIVSPAPIPGYEDAEDPHYMPVLQRLSPTDVLWDHTVRDVRKARFVTHRCVRDIEDVIHEAEQDKSLGWDMDLLRSIERNAGPDPERSARARGTLEPTRRELIFWEVWDRNHRLDNAPPEDRGFYGSIFTVLDAAHAFEGKSVEWVRKPRPYFGPRSGPYVIEGGMLVGDLIEPLAPLVGHTAQAVYLNKIARAIMRAVMDYKRLGITTDAALADKIVSGEDMSFYAAEGGVDVRQLVAQLEIGGLTQQLLTAKEDARQTLDRNSGLHDPARGNVTGVATATEINAANTSNALRSGYLVEKFRSWVRKAYEKAAFYFDVDRDVKIDVGEGVVIKGGFERNSKWSALDHERLQLRIDPFSMGRTDEQTKQLRFQLATQTLQVVASLPPQYAIALDLPWYLQLAEESSGVRELRRLFDTETYYAVQAAMLQMEMAGPPETKPTPQSRFSWNMSPAGGGGKPTSPMQHGNNKGGIKSMSTLNGNATQTKPSGPTTAAPQKGATLK